MTTDLEKKFFYTFGIEPKKEYYCPSCETKLEKWNTPKGMQYVCGNHLECDYFLDSFAEDYTECLEYLGYRMEYPQITDRILLNLILIMNPYAPPVGNTMEEMKEQVLFWCIEFADELKHQVQELFKEER